MYIKLVIAASLVLPVMPTLAQSTPAKKALIVRILKAQQPAIEAMGRAMAERPALTLLERAGAALQERVTADKRDAVGKEIQGDVKKYIDEAVPLVTSQAVRLAPSAIGPLLEEKFTEDELKQIAIFLESPAITKYQQMGGDMQKLLMEKVLADTRKLVEPKVLALDQAVSKRLGMAAPPVGTK